MGGLSKICWNFLVICTEAVLSPDHRHGYFFCAIKEIWEEDGKAKGGVLANDCPYGVCHVTVREFVPQLKRGPPRGLVSQLKAFHLISVRSFIFST